MSGSAWPLAAETIRYGGGRNSHTFAVWLVGIVVDVRLWRAE